MNAKKVDLSKLTLKKRVWVSRSGSARSTGGIPTEKQARLRHAGAVSRGPRARRATWRRRPLSPSSGRVRLSGVIVGCRRWRTTAIGKEFATGIGRVNCAETDERVSVGGGGGVNTEEEWNWPFSAIGELWTIKKMIDITQVDTTIALTSNRIPPSLITFLPFHRLTHAQTTIT